MTVEKEALAVIFGIKRFKHYLLDNPFTVISDHCTLQWLVNYKDETGRLGRWATLLAGMKYKIKYRPARVHQNADCLSCLPIAAITELTNESVSPVPAEVPIVAKSLQSLPVRALTVLTIDKLTQTNYGERLS